MLSTSPLRGVSGLGENDMRARVQKPFRTRAFVLNHSPTPLVSHQVRGQLSTYGLYRTVDALYMFHFLHCIVETLYVDLQKGTFDTCR